MLDIFFSSEGRIGRMAYVAYALLADLLIAVAVWAVLGAPKHWLTALRAPDHHAYWGTIAIIVIGVRCRMVITVKRLHDLELSAVLWCVIVLIPAGLLFSAWATGSHALGVIGGIVQLGMVAWLTFWPGTPGANSYGAAP